MSRGHPRDTGSPVRTETAFSAGNHPTPAARKLTRSRRHRYFLALCEFDRLRLFWWSLGSVPFWTTGNRRPWRLFNSATRTAETNWREVGRGHIDWGRGDGAPPVAIAPPAGIAPPPHPPQRESCGRLCCGLRDRWTDQWRVIELCERLPE